jgi:hypothetical protein
VTAMNRSSSKMAYSFALTTTLVFVYTCAVRSAMAADEALRQLRFSPDGQHLLARDDSGIAVLTVGPLAMKFRIPAKMASDAQFTPDSRQIVFVSSVVRADHQFAAFPHDLLVRSAPHLERWSIAEQTRIASEEIPPCGTLEISQDVRALACDDFEGTLRIVDIVSGGTLFARKQFVKLIPLYNYINGNVDLPNGHFLGDLGEACLDFSPDGQYLKAQACGGAGPLLVYDLHEKSVIKLGHLQRTMEHGCLFLTGGTLLIGNGHYLAKQGLKVHSIVAFPSGKLLSRLAIPLGQEFRATDPGFVITRPIAGIRGQTTLVQLGTERVIARQWSPALDAFGHFYVTDRGGGEMALSEVGGGIRAILAIGKR